jgi:tRNA (mo5U34)-methyltransferase
MAHPEGTIGSRVRTKLSSGLKRLARALDARKEPLESSIPISDRIGVLLDTPKLQVPGRGDAVAFVQQTRSVLERFPRMSRPPSASDGDDLESKARSIFWYHTIELPGGVVTDGMFDHRPLVPHYGLPDDLRGKSALDVGTWDGFWAFELERRGATVTAIDVEGLHQIDVPIPYRTALEQAGLKEYYGIGFEIARQALDSSVQRRLMNVYDLSPELGEFAFVHMGDLLLHLEFPTKALQKIRSVTGECALVATPFEPRLEGDTVRYLGGWSNTVWWLPSLETAGQMVMDAGFSSVELHTVYEMRTSFATGGSWRAVFRARP